MPVVGSVTDFDILSLTEAKAALNITDSSVDVELAQVNTAASRFVDSIDGAVVQRTITNEEHRGGGSSIQLDFWPVAAITTATEYASGTATTLTAESFTTAGTFSVDLSNGTLYRRSSWYGSVFASTGVRVNYVAGRYANTAAVDPVYKQAAAAALVHFWQHRGAQSGAATFGGDGAPFGAVPFSTMQLRKQLAAMLKRDGTPSVA